MFRKILFFFVLISIIIFYCLKNPIVQDKNTPNKPIVAITQIAPHPSLDAIRQGILDELAHQHKSVEIIYENAQGNITLAAQIANKFVSLNPKVIVSITTPSTQAVYNVAQKYRIPVVSHTHTHNHHPFSLVTLYKLTTRCRCPSRAMRMTVGCIWLDMLSCLSTILC